MGMTNQKSLLGIAQIREDYSLGRELATRLAAAMPHIVAGRTGTGPRRLVHRAELETVLTQASANQTDLWQLVRQEDAAVVLRSWLQLSQKAIN